MPDHIAQFKFYVDWGKDGSVADVGDDITEYVMSANWNIGFREPFKSAAGSTKAQLTLKNADRTFSPEYSGGPYFGEVWAGRPLRIDAIYSGGTVTLWTGYTDEIQPSTGTKAGDKTATLTAFGVDEFLKRAKFDVGIQTSIRSDAAIESILEDVAIIPATANGPWLLGIPGHSELGVTTYLQGSGLSTDLEAGKTTFEFVGDDWTQDTPAWDAIADIVEAERGKVFVNRDGELVFWNRHHLISDNTVDESFSNGWQGMQYEYLPRQYTHNVVSLTANPRKLGSSNTEVLYELGTDETIEINPGETKTLRPHFGEQTSEIRVAAVDVQQPNLSDGTFHLSQGNATIITFDVKMVTVLIKIQNAGTQKAIIDTLTIKGRKLTQYNKVTIEVMDGQAQFDTGGEPRTLTMDLKLVQNERTARSIAGYELFRRKDARGQVFSLDWVSNGTAAVTRALTRAIGDRISISEAQTGHAGEYFIVGEEHRVSGLSHRWRWYLEPADTNEYWLLGVDGRSNLGVSTYLGPV